MRANLLLLSGWGATCKVWAPIIPALEQRCQIKCVTPPWIKRIDAGSSLGEFEHFIDQLGLSLKNQKTTLVAWSLGGLIAIHLAKKYSSLIDQIIFIASVPQFVACENFPYAIDKGWFENFVNAFKDNPQSTYSKFIALQAKGDEFQMDTIRFLKINCHFDLLDQHESLLGLKLLQQQKLIREAQKLKCKLLFIHGENDAVLPFKAARYAADSTQGELHGINKAGHAPHISHPEITAELINSFLDHESI